MNSPVTRVWQITLLTLSLTVCHCIASDDPPAVDPARLARVQAISQTLSSEVPLVIAHRGASGYLPEHTTEAAAFAHALGADFIEQDVVLSKDGVAVVLHDITLNATTNVADVFPDRAVDEKFYVFDFTLSELRTLAVSERQRTDSSVRFPAGQGRFQIATLEEHIQLIMGLNKSRNQNVGLYVEIKQPAAHRRRGLDPSREVLGLLKKYGYESADDRVFLQCFEADEVLRLRTELNCRLPLIQLHSGDLTTGELAEISRVADGVGVNLGAIVTFEDGKPPQVSDLVQQAHNHALMVHVWTFRTDDLPRFAESATAVLDLLIRKAAVDGIFADQPDSVLKWRQAAVRTGAIRGPFHLLNGGRTAP